MSPGFQEVRGEGMSQRMNRSCRKIQLPSSHNHRIGELPWGCPTLGSLGTIVSGKRDTFGARPGSGRGSGAERFPACGKQVGNLSDRHGREALEDVGEIFLRVDET